MNTFYQKNCYFCKKFDVISTGAKAFTFGEGILFE